MRRFLDLLKRLQELNNFDLIFAFVAGLNNAAIARMKHTLAEIPRKQWDVFVQCDQLMQTKNNYKNYRDAVRAAAPPLVPYLGISLTDLTFAEDGNKDLVELSSPDEDARSCPHCGARANGPVCEKCGKSVVEAVAKTLYNCGACGNQWDTTESDLSFCDQCGEAVQMEGEPSKVECSKCHKSITIGSKFCGFCGQVAETAKPAIALSAASAKPQQGDAASLINIRKRLLIYDILKDLSHFQTFNYSIEEIPHLQSCLYTLASFDEKKLYELSLLREPRGAERNQLL
jgi:hypothetical protein